jgi:DNA-binding GntR family transcriptional regulator
MDEEIESLQQILEEEEKALEKEKKSQQVVSASAHNGAFVQYLSYIQCANLFSATRIFTRLYRRGEWD